MRYSLEEETPIIAKISHRDMKECFKKSNKEHIERIILFTKEIPGFEELTKNIARKIFS